MEVRIREIGIGQIRAANVTAAHIMPYEIATGKIAIGAEIDVRQVARQITGRRVDLAEGQSACESKIGAWIVAPLKFAPVTSAPEK